MNFLSLIEAKRDGHDISPQDMARIVAEYTRGALPDYQMAAWLMAVYFRGLSLEETRALTISMRDSGKTLQFPNDGRPVVDKHSTGGVGDKVSLPLAPLLACLGFRVPMISGRGLGITGGTLDKLESIPGFQTNLEPERMVRQVQGIGCVICGQSATLVPADKAIYALRDATATVPSMPLITASILSKKLAEGLDALLLDVKFGAAAFMAEREAARALAQSMVQLGRECGVRVRALLTDMNAPLGRACGNRLEVQESVACLEGRGPDDLRALVIECAAHLLAQTGQEKDEAEGRTRAASCLDSGRPREKWNEMLRAQGADLAAFEHELSAEDNGTATVEFCAVQAGFVSCCDARLVGEVVRDLGGGRQHKDSTLDWRVGVSALAKPGERVAHGDVLCRVHARNAAEAEAARARLGQAIEVADEAPRESLLVVEVVT